MRIAIDGRELEGRPTGVGVYLAGLLRSWLADGEGGADAFHRFVLYHRRPLSVALPDDPRLGEYREAFAGLLVLFEERPRDADDGGPPFAGADEIHNTASFLEAREHSPRHRLDAREFLKARLIDLLLGVR